MKYIKKGIIKKQIIFENYINREIEKCIDSSCNLVPFKLYQSNLPKTTYLPKPC